MASLISAVKSGNVENVQIALGDLIRYGRAPTNALHSDALRAARADAPLYRTLTQAAGGARCGAG